MKIPNKFKQFEDRPSIIIVAGRQDAAIYKCSGGFLERLDAFKIPTPHYSDREGAFKTRGRGVTTRSGGVREIRDDDIIRDFLSEFKKRIKKIAKNDFDSVYITAPAKTKNRIKEILPTRLRQKVVSIIEGNYFYRHPLFILEKISSRLKVDN
jgi:hypothetical protein